MKRILLLTLGCFTLFFTAQSQSWEWAKSVNGPSNEDEIDAVASDNNANVYISGKFEDSLYYNIDSLPIKSQGMADIMLIKYDSIGTIQWVKHFGGAGEDNTFDAVCDNDNNLIISGYFQQAIAFDTYSLTSLGGFDFFLVKIDPNGNVLWAKQFGGTGDEGGNEIVVDAFGNIVVSADSNGDFNVGAYNFTNTGNKDSYIISFNSNGLVNWARAIQGAGTVRGKSVAVDNFGNVYFGGDYLGPNAALDENNVTHNFALSTSRDAFVTAWNRNGAYKWQKTWGGSSGDDYCKGIATNSDGDVFMMCPFSEDVNLDGNVLDIGTQINFYVWKIDSNGTSQWVRHLYSPTEILEGGEIVADNKNGVVFGVGIQDTIFLQNSTDTSTILLPSPIAYPLFVNYNSKGDVKSTLLCTKSTYATFGEISKSGRFVFLDAPIWDTTYFGNDSVVNVATNNKDAAIVCLKLPIDFASTTELKNHSTKFVIYPNPTNKILNIKIENFNQLKSKKLIVVDASGKFVQDLVLQSEQTTIDLHKLKNGVYYIKVDEFSQIFIKD